MADQNTAQYHKCFMDVGSTFVTHTQPPALFPSAAIVAYRRWSAITLTLSHRSYRSRDHPPLLPQALWAFEKCLANSGTIHSFPINIEKDPFRLL